MLDWLASLFGMRDYDRWLPEAASVAPGADGLVLLPYLSGIFLPYTVDERAPLADPAARGVFFGLGAQHTAAHMLRATLEGVAFAVRQVYEATVAQGGPATAICTVGGQAHSRLWNQIKADVLGQQVQVPTEVEAGALGAACLAAAGSGYFPDMWAAAETMVQVAIRLEPNPAAYRRYTQLYTQVYKPLYPRVKDLFPRLPNGDSLHGPA
jgi:sugar (pentulose or hexulose) kinase